MRGIVACTVSVIFKSAPFFEVAPTTGVNSRSQDRITDPECWRSWRVSAFNLNYRYASFYSSSWRINTFQISSWTTSGSLSASITLIRG